MGKTFTIEAEGTNDYPAIMLATVRALKSIGGIGTNNEIAERIIELEEISEEEQSYPQSGDHRSRFNYALSWARTNLKISSNLDNTAFAVWALTESGFKIDSLEDAKKAFALATKIEREKRGKSSKKQDIPQNPLLDLLKKMDSGDFEMLCKILLLKAGFSEVKLEGKATAADGGIDGSGILPINLISFHVCFQCKCWTDAPVRSKDIRDFRGALQGRADKGLFITTSNFTNDATTESTRDGALTIDLINGERLCDLLKEHKIVVKLQKDKIIHITKDKTILAKFTLPTPKPTT